MTNNIINNLNNTISTFTEKYYEQVKTVDDNLKNDSSSLQSLRLKRREDVFVKREISTLAEKIENNSIYTESASKIIAESIVTGTFNSWA